MSKEPAGTLSIEQLRGEQCRQWRQGVRITAEELLACYPGFRTDPDAVLELIYQEVVLRCEAGEAPRLQDYAMRFPDLADRLAPLFEIHQALEAPSLFGPSPGDTGLGTTRQTLPEATGSWTSGPGEHAAPGVPGYELLDVLGRGGMGVVYKARQVGLKRLVAIKMILSGSHAGPQERSRFFAEAEAVARLQHPNIVQIFEVGQHADSPFLSLELVEGGTLAKRLAGTPLPPREAAELTEILARAMHAAHQAGVIHRDLKPVNVLLTSDGRPKISDFGLAKQLDEDVGRTQSGAILGTPSYMAPEQALGNIRQIGPPTDVYALGAILYEMLTGRSPFKVATLLETLEQVRTQEPVSPRQLQPRTPRDLETICLKCLQKDPAKRYATAADLADDLHRFADGRPILARPVGSFSRLVRACRRRPALAASIGAAVLGLLAVTGVSVAFALSESASAKRILAEQDKTEKALKQSEINLGLATTNENLANQRSREANHKAAEIALSRGVSLCEQGDSGRGMHWLVRSLGFAIEAKDAELERSVRLLLAAWGRELNVLRSPLPHPPGVDDNGVESVGISHDGSVVLSGTNQDVRIWKATPSGPHGLLAAHQFFMPAAVLSPDGRHILSGYLAHLYDAASGQCVGMMPHEPSGNVKAFSPDGSLVATGGPDKTARVWRVAYPLPVTKLARPVCDPLPHNEPVNSVAISRDNKRLVTGTTATGTKTKTGSVTWASEARLWDVATGKMIGKPLPCSSAVVAVSFGPGDKGVLTCCQAGIRWRDAETGELLAPAMPAGTDIRTLVSSPDGKTIFVGSDRGAQLWDVAGGKMTGAPFHRGAVRHISFSAEGTRILAVCDDRMTRVWDVETRRAIGQPLPHEMVHRGAAFNFDGRLTVTAGIDRTARVWQMNAALTSDRIRIQTPSDFGHRFAFDPDGTTVVHDSLGQEQNPQKGKIGAYDAATGEALGPLMTFNGPVAIGASRRTVMVAEGNTLRLWEAATGKPLGVQFKSPSELKGLALSPDDKWVLGQCADNQARVWDAMTGEARGVPLPLYKQALMEADVVRQITADGRTALIRSAISEESHILWDVLTGKPLGPKVSRTEGVLSPDGKWVLVSGIRDARIWDAKTGEAKGPALTHQGVVHGVFSPDSLRVLTGSEDRTARLWDVETGAPLGPPMPHIGAVENLAFSHDGRILLTTSRTRSGELDEARLWDTATCWPLGPPVPVSQNRSYGVGFNRDDTSAIVGGSFSTIQRWSVPTPITGDPKRVELWVQVSTGLELDKHGAIRLLDADSWHDRSRRLRELGGPLTP